jgi:hypothetical protein
VANAMEETPDHAVAVATISSKDAAVLSPLLSASSFDFETCSYTPPTLLQQMSIYIRMKVSDVHRCVLFFDMCSLWDLFDSTRCFRSA